jgi:F420-non-reducing hydrogenase iron-sulfur subunit
MRERKPKILILATTVCAYPGADTTGQMHLEYTPNTYIIRVASPVIFPESFYFKVFESGFDGIIVMACGSDCPYEGAYKKFSDRIQVVYREMRARGIDPRRLKMCSICTVCTRPFLGEIEQMNKILDELGVIDTASGDATVRAAGA